MTGRSSAVGPTIEVGMEPAAASATESAAASAAESTSDRQAVIRQPDAAGIAAAVDALAAGHAIGLPTETVYGLAADAGSSEAVASIYRIKGRPTDHPLIVHVLDADQAARWAVWDERAAALAAAFWPGPLTLVLRRRADAPAWACAAQSTIALRAPSHPVARAVLERGRHQGIAGLAAPSANRYGRVSPTRAGHVVDDLGGDVALVLDGGDAEVGIESTIIDLSGPEARLLRPGGIDAASLFRVLAAGPGVVAEPGDGGAATTPVPRVPGDRVSHYAPVTPTVVIAAGQLPAEVDALRRAGRRIALWSVMPPSVDGDGVKPGVAAGDGPGAGPGAGLGSVQWRARPTEPGRFAHELYEGLRTLDRSGCDVIVIEAPPADAAWAAVNDRLTRASAR